MKNIRILFCLGCLGSILLFLTGCKEDHDELRADIEQIKARVTALESSLEQLTQTATHFNQLQQEQVKIVGISPRESGYWVELSNGTSLELAAAGSVEGQLPLIRINKEGYWELSWDAGNTYQALLHEGAPVAAVSSQAQGITPQFRISQQGYWQVSYDQGNTYTDLLADGAPMPALEGSSASSIFSAVQYLEAKSELKLTLAGSQEVFRFPVLESFYLRILGLEEKEALFMPGAKEEWEVEQLGIERVMIQAPAGWKVELKERSVAIQAPQQLEAGKELSIDFVLTSAEGYIRMYQLPVRTASTRYENAPRSWREFESNDPNNILPDFSFAGYKHGEVAPPSVEELKAQGYQVYNVMDYGAIPNDGKSDRAAFIRVLEAIGATRGKDGDAIRYQLNGPAKAIIYFPAGEFILQGEGENNQPLRLTFGDYVIKGAGRAQTTIKMEVQNEPKRPDQMWSAPVMLELKHNSGLQALTTVTQDAPKGGFTVDVASTLGIQVGDWVCLQLVNNDPELVAQELQPWKAVPRMTNLLNKGVQIYDYHQVQSIKGNKLTFKEPLMHAVEAKWNWQIMKYPHYENVGIEDLTFEGAAKPDFAHHASAADDGAFKIVDMVRLTNSWMRRVDFVSVSEASSITSSANVSVYDVEIRGNRGHSAIRSQASSRVFIGKVRDKSDGYEALTSNGSIGNTILYGAGQYHACGASKQSMGAVIWNVHWGQDGCFESHATQPRATLIDHCKGAFIPWRQGGDEVQLPNHLDDLVIWNMNATRVKYDRSWGGRFIWWDVNNRWWKNLPPTIVGFHGESIVFGEPEKQLKRLESQGEKVEPASLYEAQLLHRLGYVPAWLSALK